MSIAVKNYVNLSVEDVIKELIYDFVGEIPIRVERFSTGGLNSELHIYDPSTGRHYNATVDGICRLKEDHDERMLTRLAIRRASGRYPWDRVTRPALPDIKKVIFNNPATIVFWSDGTKTVVKAKNEPFDKEKGLAMAIAKKTLGNKGNYFEIFKKYCEEV